MIETGADIYQAVLKEEMKMNPGKDGLKNTSMAKMRVSEMMQTKIEQQARNGYYNAIRSMVGQQCRKQQE